MKNNELTKISLFQGKQIRRAFHENEWWFSVIDVVGFLTESQKPRDYWHKMKIRKKKSANIQLSTICRQLKLEAPDGKQRETDCANTEGIFRILQSVPSPKAEPFKQWLAKVGKERIDEIENPELGMDRVKSIYEKKGYDKGWLDKRMRGISARHTLTDELDMASASNLLIHKSFCPVRAEGEQSERLEV
jgi:BRO family, N-terminal domain.